MAIADKRPFKAYDAEGNVHGYKTAIDQHHACVLAGYTLSPPGQPEPVGADPMRRYDVMSAEELRQQCIAKRIPQYLVMDRDQKIAALRAADAAPAPVVTTAKKAK
jgi:hypothetical protein